MSPRTRRRDDADHRAGPSRRRRRRSAPIPAPPPLPLAQDRDWRGSTSSSSSASASASASSSSSPQPLSPSPKNSDSGSGSGSESESESEYISKNPPRVEIRQEPEPEDEGPPSPTSPTYSPLTSADEYEYETHTHRRSPSPTSPLPSPRIRTLNPTTHNPPPPTLPLESRTNDSDIEKRNPLDAEDSPNSMPVTATTYLDDDLVAISQSRCNQFACTAMEYYNNDEKNKIKYELISGVTWGAAMDLDSLYAHVNFTARENQQNSKEVLFFAELLRDRESEGKIWHTTCVLPLLEGKIGGLCDSPYDNSICTFKGVPIDNQYCYACVKEIKHPKNGALYEGGHVAASDWYI